MANLTISLHSFDYLSIESNNKNRIQKGKQLFIGNYNWF